MNQATTFRTRRRWTGVVLGVLTVLAFAGPAHAQDQDGVANEAFLATVAETRDAAAQRIEDAQRAIEVACVGLATEACLTTHVAEQLATVADELEAYAAQIEGLDVPEEFAGDVEVQATWLIEHAELVRETVVAASAADTLALDETFGRTVTAMETLAAQLGPEWGRAAYLTSFGASPEILASAGDLTSDERAYLAAARATEQAAASNFACFGRAIQETYGSTDALLQALTDCGAGEALPAIEAAALELEPPPRFVDEHAWWLATKAELSRYDRLIGEAAAEGDVVKFLVNNVQTGNVFRGIADLDPAFVGGAPIPGQSLDPTEPLARTPYGQALFAALMDYGVINPFAATLGALQFPQVPRGEAFPAVVALKPEFQALNAELKAAVDALEPPPELAADHAVITEFFETYTQGLDDMFAAAEAEDAAASFALENAADGVFCEASSALSETILPVAEAFFDPDAAICA